MLPSLEKQYGARNVWDINSLVGQAQLAQQQDPNQPGQTAPAPAPPAQHSTGLDPNLKPNDQSAAGPAAKPASKPAAQKTPANSGIVAKVRRPQWETVKDITPGESAASRLEGLVSSNSPYLQSARARGAQAANARGMINSSLGIETAERAAIDAAAPLAIQDANTTATAVRDTRNYNRENTQLGYQANLTSAQELEKWRQTMTGAQREEFSARYQTGYDRMMAEIGRINTDASLSTEGKKNAIAWQQNNFKQYTNTLGKIYSYNVTWGIPAEKTPAKASATAAASTPQATKQATKNEDGSYTVNGKTYTQIPTAPGYYSTDEGGFYSESDINRMAGQ